MSYDNSGDETPLIFTNVNICQENICDVEDIIIVGKHKELSYHECSKDKTFMQSGIYENTDDMVSPILFNQYNDKFYEQCSVNTNICSVQSLQKASSLLLIGIKNYWL